MRPHLALGGGAALPPLPLADEEAVAIVLRTAATGSAARHEQERLQRDYRDYRGAVRV